MVDGICKVFTRSKLVHTLTFLDKIGSGGERCTLRGCLKQRRLKRCFENRSINYCRRYLVMFFFSLLLSISADGIFIWMSCAGVDGLVLSLSFEIVVVIVIIIIIITTYCVPVHANGTLVRDFHRIEYWSCIRCRLRRSFLLLLLCCSCCYWRLKIESVAVCGSQQFRTNVNLYMEKSTQKPINANKYIWWTLRQMTFCNTLNFSSNLKPKSFIIDLNISCGNYIDLLPFLFRILFQMTTINCKITDFLLYLKDIALTLVLKLNLITLFVLKSLRSKILA